MNAKQEQILRKHIRNKIQQKHNQTLMERKMVRLQEMKLRKVIRGILLKEASEVNFDSMSRSTGINILKKTMKKVAGILQDTYMSLSSSKEQRDSFRAHILRNIVDLFIRVDLLSDRDESGEGEGGKLPVTPETNPVPTKAMTKGAETIQEEEKGKKKNNVKEEIDVDVKEEEDADAPAIPTNLPPEADMTKQEEPKGPTSEKVKDKEFVQLPGKDPTGRNVAMETFPFIQKSIADDYSLLSLEKDKEEYKAYLLANVKAYFDQGEQKLAAMVEEPYSSEYEKVKEKYKQYEEPTQGQIAESLSYFKVIKILTNGKQIL